MQLIRFYRKGSKPKYTVSEEYLKTLKSQNREFIDNASVAIVLDTDEEEKIWFNECLNRVYNNPGYYLRNLDSLMTFRVNIKKIFPDKIMMKEKDKKHRK